MGIFKDWFLYYIFADRSHWTFPGRADLYSLADLDHWRYHSPCNIKIRKSGVKMAKKAKEEKTNVMRLLEQAKVEYKHYSYANTDAISGVEVAEVLGQNVDKVFKTLVTVGKSGEHYVFVVPVAEELDLKKAANAVGEKSIAMVKSKELLGLTGYIHGGCSPIGMKKLFQTVIHQSAEDFDTIIFSGGKIGYQVEVSLEGLRKVIAFTTTDIIV